MKQLLTILLLLFACGSMAQQDSSTVKKVSFRISANYQSALHYFGRVDSISSSGYFPLAELWVNDRFYVNAAPVFVNNAVQPFEYAGTVASAGYQAVSGKWITTLYAMKPFYTESARLVQSALQAQAGLNVSRLTPVLNFNAGADIKLSDRLDAGLSAGIDHLVRRETPGGGAWIIDPSIYAYAGTQNFTNTYNRKKSDFLLFPGGEEQVSEEVTKFRVLAYEVTAPVIYVKNKWMLSITPSFVIPQNLVTVPGRPSFSERGENLLYATASMKYSF